MPVPATSTRQLSHVFLNALEESGSTNARTGWAPQHLTFAGNGGRLVGAVPMYLKSHSYGEYIFDWGWADAYERSGSRYYPKAPVRRAVHPGAGPPSPGRARGGGRDQEPPDRRDG